MVGKQKGLIAIQPKKFVVPNKEFSRYKIADNIRVVSDETCSFLNIRTCIPFVFTSVHDVKTEIPRGLASLREDPLHVRRKQEKKRKITWKDRKISEASQF